MPNRNMMTDNDWYVEDIVGLLISIDTTRNAVTQYFQKRNKYWWMMECVKECALVAIWT